MRMQAYRLSLSVATADTEALPRQLAEFERSLELLRNGDPERPLFVPWDDAVRQDFAVVERDWSQFRRAVDARAVRFHGGAARRHRRVHRAHRCARRRHRDAHVALDRAPASAADRDDGAGRAGRRGAALHRLPVRAGARRAAEGGDRAHSARAISAPACSASPATNSARWRKGFNGMAEHLQSMYRDLEARVAEKTSELEEKRERLEALYDVTALAAKATTLEELAAGFTQHMGRVARADGVALRWSDETNQRFLLLASRGPARRHGRRRAVRQGRRVLLRLAIGIERRARHCDSGRCSLQTCTTAAMPASRRSCRSRSGCTTA